MTIKVEKTFFYAVLREENYFYAIDTGASSYKINSVLIGK